MPFITRQFTYTGAIQNFTVPNFVTEIIIKAWGAGAGGGGGPGGYSTGRISVIPGDIFNMTVGQGGQTNQTTSTFGGGGGTTSNPFDPTIVGASGGGASYLYKNTSTLLLVAGGGGGGGSAGGFSYGGSGGGLTGTTAPSINTTNTGGSGGTQIAGGSGGINVNTSSLNGTAGSSFQGGKGGGTNSSNAGTAGGGGGGYFGGGGGAGQASAGQQETAGGGGSSYIGGVIGGSTLSTPQNTTGAAASFLPPNTTDSSYIANVGIGRPFPGFGPISTGGNGLIVLSYTLPDLVLNKTVDKSYANTDNILVYTIAVKNTGPATLTNIVFVDTIPVGTTFVNNSLTIDNSPSTNNPNPPGFTITSLNPNVTTTISYSVKVASTLPNQNPIQNIASAAYPQSASFNSNTVSTQINRAILNQSKQVNKSYANISEILTYTIPITNSGNVTANNLLFIDTIPNGTSLISGSFKQDGVVVSGSPNPPGITLGNLGPGKTTTIVFQVKVDTIPNPNPIPNSANSQSTYTVDPSIPNNDSANSNSNIVNTQINNANLGNIVKYTDKSFATCGDEIIYTIVIPNVGNVTAQNVVFKDTIPNGTSFITNSVYINGNQSIGSNPSTGFSIQSISPGSTTTITFSVKVLC